jgi:hypothetical protein
MEIEGRSYTFRLTTSAMAELEDACSTSAKRDMFFPEILERVLKGSAKYIRLFVWASLIEHHPELTVKDVGTLIDNAGGMLAFSRRIEQIYDSTQPDPEDESRPLVAQANGVGGRSMSKHAKSA